MIRKITIKEYNKGQQVLLLDRGYLTLKEQYIDGTKMESRANRYTFVWKKSVEKNKAKLKAKIRCILQDIEEGIACDNLSEDEPPTPIKSEEFASAPPKSTARTRVKKQQRQLAEIAIENQFITNTDNLYYNAEDDYFVCLMEWINPALREYKKKARELLTSEEGLRHRSRRCIEPEAVFGQMKANKHYKRFRHFGKEKITMDFAIFAIAFNIGKMWNRGKKQGNTPTLSAKNRLILFLVVS